MPKNTGNDDDDERKRFMNKRVKRYINKAKSVACIGDLIRIVEDSTSKIVRNCQRRRNSYRLSVYFQFVGFICCGYSIFSGTLWGYVWTRMSNFRSECIVPQSMYDLKKQADMQEYVKENKRGFLCANELWAVEAMACPLLDIEVLQGTMLTSCIVNAIQGFFCLCLCGGFRFFSNLPAHALGRPSKKMLCCGGWCKHGPWIVRLIHLIQLIVWFVFISDLQAQYKCKGDTSYSYDCVNSQSDCAYIQLLNCRYFWGSDDQYCEGRNVDMLLECFNPEMRAPFTGAADVRMMTDSPCLRCALLKTDSQSKDTDDFGLQDELGHELQNWCMEADPTSCFKLKKIHLLPLYCHCPKDMAARVTDRERYKYGLNQENCVGFDDERRLAEGDSRTNMAPPEEFEEAERIFRARNRTFKSATQEDVEFDKARKDSSPGLKVEGISSISKKVKSAITSIHQVDEVASATLADGPASATLALSPQPRSLQQQYQPGYGGQQQPGQAGQQPGGQYMNPYENEPEPPKGQTSDQVIRSAVSYFTWLSEREATWGEGDAFGISTLWDADEICMGTGDDDTDLCQQECTWAPITDPGFYFPKENCQQAGSFLYRYCLMYCYSFGCGWLVMTLVGVLVRITAKPETWFFNPRDANECFIWQWLRVLGP